MNFYAHKRILHVNRLWALVICSALCMHILISCLSSSHTPTNTDSNLMHQSQNKESGTPPKWYSNQQSSQVSSGFFYGYGSAPSAEEARNNALTDIAFQIEAQIKSEVTSKSVSTEESAYSVFREHGRYKTDILLRGAIREQQEHIDGVYYVRYRYDNRAIGTRILSMSTTPATPILDTRYKAQLPFYQLLSRNGNATNYFLSHHKIWYISIAEQQIPLSTKDFADNFFTSRNSHLLTLVPGAKNGLSVPFSQEQSLEHGQLYSIEYTLAREGESSFISLLYVDYQGIVQVLMANKEYTRGSKVQFPDLDAYEGLQASNKEAYTIRDMILAVESSGPLEFLATFEVVSDSAVNTEEDFIYSYGRLIEQLDGVFYSSQIIKIKGSDS